MQSNGMEFSTELICMFIFTSICIISAFIYRHVSKLYTYFDKRGIPGPVPSFLVGTWREAPKKFLGNIDIENAKLYGKTYGTFDGLTPNLMVLDVEIIRELLLHHSDSFVNRRILKCKNETLKECLTMFYGEIREGSQTRQFCLEDYMLEKIRPSFESAANNLVNNVLKKKEEGVGFNFVSIVNDYTHDLIALSVFGIDLNSDIAFKDEFSNYCNQLFKMKTPTSDLSLIPLLYENKSEDSWIMPQKALDYFVRLIKRGINDRTPKDSVSNEFKGANLIEIIEEAFEKNKSQMQLEENDSYSSLKEAFIIHNCLDSILTMARKVKFFILVVTQCLGYQLEVQEDLSRELEKNKSEKLRFNSIKIMEKIMLEVLRLYPFEFRMERVCTKGVKIQNLNFVEGDRVSVPLFALYRQEDYFPDPEKFDLSRSTFDCCEKMCLPLGQVSGLTGSMHLCLNSSCIAIFKLIEKFHFKAPDNSNRVIFETGITGVPKIAALNIIIEVKS